MKTLLKIIAVLLLLNLLVLSLCSNPVNRDTTTPAEFSPIIYDVTYQKFTYEGMQYVNFYGTSTRNLYMVSTVIQCLEFSHTYIWNCTDDYQNMFAQKPFSFTPPAECDLWYAGEYTILLRCKQNKFSDDTKTITIKIQTGKTGNVISYF